MLSTAPPGSRTIACVNAGGASNGPCSTDPPRRRTTSTPRCDVVDPEVHAPDRIGTWLGRDHHGHDVAGDWLGLLAAEVAREPEHRRWAERLRLPAEHGAVEPRRAVGVSGLQRAHRPGSGLVDQLCALSLAAFPRAEHSALRVLEHTEPTDRREVDALLEDRAARLAHPANRGLEVVHADLHHPGRRRVRIGHRADRGDVAATQTTERVGRQVVRSVLGLPAEQLRVERGRRRDVVLQVRHPAGNAGRVGVSLAHLSLLAVVSLPGP